jgi:hypothetical protein
LGLGRLCETSGVLRVAPPPWCSRPMRNRPAPAVGVPAGASAVGGPADRVGRGREQAPTGRMPGEALKPSCIAEGGPACMKAERAELREQKFRRRPR